MPLPPRLVLLAATVMIDREEHGVSFARGRAEIDRRLAAVAADLEQRTVDGHIARGSIQRAAFVGRHESTRRFGQREERIVHAQTDSAETAMGTSGLWRHMNRSSTKNFKIHTRKNAPTLASCTGNAPS